jgi:hypothetical protein
MTAGLMLDPSLFLAERTLDIAIREIESARVAVSVPGHFLTLAQDASLFDRVGDFFEASEGDESGSSRAASLFRDWVPQSQGLLVPYTPTPHDLANAFRGEFETRLNSLALSDDTKTILIEEWVYLQTQSWIGSRLRAASDCFKNAGAEVYDLSRQAFRFFAEHAKDDVPELLKRKNLLHATKMGHQDWRSRRGDGGFEGSVGPSGGRRRERYRELRWSRSERPPKEGRREIRSLEMAGHVL